jgi:hypothetical protein
MRNFGPPLIFSSLLLIAAITLSCGLSNPRMLETVSVTPATADAQDFPNGVPFIATGYYTQTPSPVSPETATWGACYQGGATTGISISAAGVARCAAGASGVYTVWASVPNPAYKGACPQIETACGLSCPNVVGMALLTCP